MTDGSKCSLGQCKARVKRRLQQHNNSLTLGLMRHDAIMTYHHNQHKNQAFRARARKVGRVLDAPETPALT